MLRSHACFSILTVAAAGLLAAANPPSGFDAHVPPREVRAALLNLDPPALAAVAAKVTVAEKALGMPRPKMTGVQFYELTIQVAAERGDRATLERLNADGGVTAIPRLAALLSAARLKSGAARNSTDPEMMVALDQITPDQFALFRGYLTQIQDARALADRGALEAMTAHVTGVPELTAPQRKYLARRIATVIKDLPEKPPAALVAARKEREEAVRGAIADPSTSVDTSPEEKPKPEKVEKGDPMPPGAVGFAARLTGDAAALTDDGFEGRIDLVKVGKAWGRGDAVALADLAFRMAEEERILGRPHRHVPAKTLFNAALGLAIANEDGATVARLEKGLKGDRAPDFDGKADVLVKLTASKGLGFASRKGRPSLVTRIDDVSPTSFATFRDYLERIRAAGSQRDVHTLTGLAEGLDTVLELDEGQRAYLAREAKEARAAGPAPPSAAALKLLAGGSRGEALPPLNRQVLQFCTAHVGQKVDNGESANLATQALDSAGAKLFPPSGPAAERVWGRPVKPAEALPGDVLQFRDVLLRVTFPGGRKQEWSYPHQTAVIDRVNGPGRFAILQQDVGPRGKADGLKKLVQVGSIDLATVVSGRVEIYRPVAR